MQGFTGLLIATVLTALLAYQAARAAAGSRLRQTYSLAAGGFGLILALNFLYMQGVGGGLLGNTVGFAAVAMLIGAVAAFGASIFNGEFTAKIRAAQDYTASQRDEIARQRAERERAMGADKPGTSGGQE
jgi:hypothetical protein